VATDFTVRTAFPIPRDVKVRVPSVVQGGGGPAANAAVALARLGVDSHFVGAVGDDALGERQLRDLAIEGVDVTGALRVARASFLSFILVDESDGSLDSREDAP
jgi:sugar/nucleoside kinase (ribokinase family)